MKKVTESGAFVLFPFRPLPIGLVFTDKAVFDTAQRRYSAAVTVYGLTLLLLLAGFWSVENEPDWAFKLAYAGLAAAIPTCYLIVLVLMPRRELYRKSVHGALQ